MITEELMIKSVSPAKYTAISCKYLCSFCYADYLKHQCRQEKGVLQTHFDDSASESSTLSSSARLSALLPKASADTDPFPWLFP